MTPLNRTPGRLRSLAETAEALGVSIKTIRRLIARSELRAHRIGRSVRVSDEDLAIYLLRIRG